MIQLADSTLLLGGLAWLTALAMVLSLASWLMSCSALLWIVMLRPAYVALLAVLMIFVGAVALWLLFKLTGARLWPEAAMLALWLTPLGSLPLLNLLACVTSKGRPPPISADGSASQFLNFIIDEERARRRRASEAASDVAVLIPAPPLTGERSAEERRRSLK